MQATSRRIARGVVLALAVVLASMSVDVPAGAIPDRTVPGPAVIHRIVWDLAPGRGSDVRAADLDGGAQATLYRSSTRQVDNLAISGDGSRVAFSPYRRGRRISLLVVPTGGGRPVDVLRKSPPLVYVGPIGWSPDGRRLVFDAATTGRSTGAYSPSFLFTVHADGTGLRRLRRTSDGSVAGPVFGGIAWTPDGIVYQQGNTVRRLAHGRSEALFRSVVEMYPTGDGTAIFYRSAAPSPGAPGIVGQRIYRSSTSVPAGELVATLPDPVLGSLIGLRPDHDGGRLLGLRSRPDGSEPDVVTYHPVEPRDLQVLTFVGSPLALTWS